MKIIKNRFIFLSVSAVVIIVCIASMIINKARGKGMFNYDIQFTGGTSIEVNLGQTFDNTDIENIVKEITGASSPQVQKVGTSGTVVNIKTAKLSQESRVALEEAICEKYNITSDLFSVEDVSATISSEMQRTSIISMLIACAAMLIYVTFRFRDFRTGCSAIIALFHDTIIVIGFYALLRIPLNSSFIAAVLTILGYSINASIIIFDRIRENKRKFLKKDTAEIVDLSVGQTMRRTLFTSLTTFFTVISLYVFGVESVKEFALPIAIGIICGGYSSIFIAGSVYYTLCNVKLNKAK